jgi:outer membrane protein
MIRVAVLGTACLLGTTAVRSQAAGSSATGGKIGVINLRQAIAATAEGKQAQAELQSQFSARQNELESLNKQINDLGSRLNAGASTLSDEEKARLQQQGTRLTQQLDRKNNEMREDVQAAEAEVFDRIGRKMLDVVERYSRENSIVAVFDAPSQQNISLLYAASNIDITQEIIKLYDQAYPLKSASTPAKPAAKPATPPAGKP